MRQLRSLPSPFFVCLLTHIFNTPTHTHTPTPTPTHTIPSPMSLTQAANISLTSIVLLATCGPTILLHAFTKPYIFALRLLPPPSLPPPQEDSTPLTTSRRNTDRIPDVHFSADTINWLSRRVTTTFNLSDVKPLPRSTRPFVSFSARDRLYFVHGETFPDKDLLEKLLGRPLKKSELENGGGINR